MKMPFDIGDLITVETNEVGYSITNMECVCEVVDFAEGLVTKLGTDLTDVNSGIEKKGDIIVKLIAHKYRKEKIGKLYRVISSNFVLFNPNEHHERMVDENE
jgi:hypothetical protein